MSPNHLTTKEREEAKGAADRAVTGMVPVAAALALGAAVGLLNNLMSGWVHRLAGKIESSRRPAPADGSAGGSEVSPAPVGSWPSLFAVQFIVRLVLSVLSLYVTFRLFGGSAGPILANLAGLLATRYILLWRLGHDSAGGAASGGAA